MKQKGRSPFIALFLAPASLMYGLFVLYPLIQAFKVSTYRWRGYSANMTFTGTENFKKLAADDNFKKSLTHNLWLLVVAGFIVIALAVAVAHGLQGKDKVSRTLKGIVLFPQIVSLVVVAVLWTFIYNPRIGLLTSGMQALHLDRFVHTWLGEPETALPAVGIAFIWYAVGFYIMLFAAGLRSIPTEVTEAAELDGAVGMRRFWRVTWPMLWSVKKVAITYLMITVMNIFALVFLMTNGGPSRSTEVMLTYLYESAFKNSEYGYATTIAVANFVIVMILSGVLLFFFRKNPEGSRS